MVIFMKQIELRFIQDQIGYEFKNANLLQQAFTRSSYSEEHGGENNEVLEFIGDKVLDYFVVKILITQNSNSSGLYKKFEQNLIHTWTYEQEKKNFPKKNTFICNHNEAELTEIKKQLVQKKTLAMRIDDLGIADYLIMGNGDIQRNTNEENSVKEDLFEAILGAIAIDSNWDMEALQSAVESMLNPECIIAENEEEDYISLIQEWVYTKTGGTPLYHLKKASYQASWYDGFNGITQDVAINDTTIHKTQYHCLLRIADNLPNFRGFGQSKSEARRNVCQLAYDYLCKEGLWISIRDEIDNPSKDNAINQLEILARRGYFSLPIYEFEQTYDKNGNPIWQSICQIVEYNKAFSEKASSKKDAKKAAAYKMLQHVLEI